MVTHENLDLVFQVRALAGQWFKDMKDIRTLILAAGKGTRMKSDVPKVLHNICGKPIIRYVLDAVEVLGSQKTYVVLGHKSELIEDYLGEEYKILHQKQLLGTADAVKCAQKFLKGYRGHLLVLCGDTPLLNKNSIRNLIKKHKKTNSSCTFLTAVLHNPSGYGRVIRDEGGKVVAIREEKDAVGLEKNIAEINAGVYCFRNKELFQGLNQIKLNKRKKEFYLTDIIEHFTQNGLKVDTLEAEDAQECLGINTRQDLAESESIIRQRILKEFMLQGVTVLDPVTTYIDASARIGKDTVIRPYSYIEQNVRIGTRCLVGPFARLRPGTKVGNNVEIGNFTEVSRSKIGNHSIMKHFGFIGDASVGAHVNIGAGTVTANYDGKQKNATSIANNAFIGSDSVLVAPVKIGRHATIGAGSVVTRGKNVPDGAIAYGVPARISKNGSHS